MTTPLERYLADIRSALPPDVNADDILAEIADDLQSRIDEGEDERTAIARYGHPDVVAARYRRVQYLIGPALFPYYLATLRNVLVATIALELSAGGLAAIVMHRMALFSTALSIVWNSVAWVAIVITLIFAIRERTDSFTVPTGSPRPGALIEFIANMFMVIVTIDAPNLAANLHLSFAPGWIGAYLGTIAGAALVAGSAMTFFVQPRYERLHEIMRIISSFIVLGGLIYTLASGWHILPIAPGLETSVFYTLLAFVGALAINIVTSVRSLTKERDLVLHSLERGHH